MHRLFSSGHGEQLIVGSNCVHVWEMLLDVSDCCAERQKVGGGGGAG